MYGLKQAPRQWNAKLTDALLKFKFQQSQYDHSLFIKKGAEGITIVLVYVDDMLITGDSLKLIEDTKMSLQEAFKMKDLGELKYFLGIEFARCKEGILMHQRKYALELISRTGLGAARPAMTPMDTNVKLTTKEYDDHIFKDTKQAETMADQGSYQKLIGKLLYITMTRPDISCCVQTLSQLLQAPKQSHMEAALRIVRYLKKQPGQGVLLSSKGNNMISTYCDADWAACPNSRRSVTGYIVKLGESLIIWKSKKKKLSLRAQQKLSTGAWLQL